VDAFEAANLDAIVALFHADMRTTMPPLPIWLAGRAENERFYRRLFGDLVPGQFRHLYIGANGQPALAFYRPPSPGAPHALHAIQLVTTREGAIATVDHFMQPELLAAFGAPAQFSELRA
jgi:RNA polymerase sigma-70 factor (ECF subfamily)